MSRTGPGPQENGDHSLAGVEHLLRDVKDATISTLATDVRHHVGLASLMDVDFCMPQVAAKLSSLRGLESRLKEIRAYMQAVVEERLPLNYEIMCEVQDILSLLPNLDHEELVKAFATKTNDMMLAIYVASLIRSVIALHNLINNKVRMGHAPARCTF